MAVALCAIAGCATLPGNGSIETTAGRFKSAQAGSGAPTVVFEAGAGDGLETWTEVFPEVTKFTTAIAYSRRGYGWGVPALSQRDGATVVAELRLLLAAQKLPPPYVLVGHSLGGLYVQLFAKLYPAEVAGVVLVDPTPPDHLARMQQERPGNYALVKTMLAVNAAKTLGAELRGLDETSRQWHQAGPFPGAPMILLSARRATWIDGPGFAAFLQERHRELVRAWPGAEQRLIDSTHYIQRDQPDAVTGAIREIVRRSR